MGLNGTHPIGAYGQPIPFLFLACINLLKSLLTKEKSGGNMVSNRLHYDVMMK